MYAFFLRVGLCIQPFVYLHRFPPPKKEALVISVNFTVQYVTAVFELISQCPCILINRSMIYSPYLPCFLIAEITCVAGNCIGQTKEQIVGSQQRLPAQTWMGLISELSSRVIQTTSSLLPLISRNKSCIGQSQALEWYVFRSVPTYLCLPAVCSLNIEEATCLKAGTIRRRMLGQRMDLLTHIQNVLSGVARIGKASGELLSAGCLKGF